MSSWSAPEPPADSPPIRYAWTARRYSCSRRDAGTTPQPRRPCSRRRTRRRSRASARRKSPLASTTLPWTAAGRYPESLMCARAMSLRVVSIGGARACWGVARITGGESPCAMVPTTSSPTVATGWGLTVGDTVRARLLDPRKLSVDHGASAARARERQSRHHDRRDGVRGDARARRPRRWRELHRPDHRQAAARPRTGGDPGGKCLRIGPHSAQFQKRAVPEWTRQLERPGRAILDGYGGQQCERADSAPREPAAAQ